MSRMDRRLSTGQWHVHARVCSIVYVVSGGSGGSGDSCSQHCVPSALWSYQVGREYTYDYQVEAISSMKGTTDEESSLMIEAKVTFQLLSPCNFLLKV